MRRPTLLEIEFAIVIVLQLGMIAAGVWTYLDIKADAAAIQTTVEGICKRMAADSWVYC